MSPESKQAVLPRLFELQLDDHTGEIINFTVTPDTSPKYIVFGGYSIEDREELEQPTGGIRRIGVDY
jgi:hypothetical protein